MIVRGAPSKGLIAVHTTEPRQIALLKSWSPIRYEPFNGGQTFLLQASTETLRKIWWLGGDVQGMAPFYQWPKPLVEGLYEPMPHQVDTAAFLTLHNRAYVTSTMRTGKTGAVALALEYLRTHGDPGMALIICPVSVMRGVWGQTLDSMSPAPITILRGSAAERRKLLKDANSAYLIINYEGVEIVEAELLALLKAGRITKCVIDELTHYGNPQTRRWKAANRLLNGTDKMPIVWGLTGTPGADVLAVYGYAKLVNPQQLHWNTLNGWTNAVKYRYGPEPWQWSDRPEAPEIVRQTLQPNIRYRKEDVLPHLPRVMRQNIIVELTEDQKKAYRALVLQAQALLEDGTVITADQKAALLHKVFQVSLGHVLADDGRVATIDNSPRIKALVDLIQQSANKTVIFGTYISANDALVKRLREKQITVEKIDGSVTGSARDKIFSQFQNSANPKVLVAHARTTAYGVDLAQADQIIFNGPMMAGLHTFLQAIERLSSQKQEALTVSIFNVTATTEEATFQKGLNAGARAADSIADAFNTLVRGG
jgi:SNF2 family DNA or RNA helicase